MKAKPLILRLIVAVLFLSSSYGSSFGTSKVSASTQNTLHLNVISSGETETILELVIDGFQTETFEQDGQAFQRIIIDQTVQSTKVDEPQVPIYSTLVGLASTENISLQVISAQSTSYQGFTLPIVEEFTPQADNLLDPQKEIQIETRLGNETTASGKILPLHLAEISQSGYLRDQAFAQITFYPVQYDREHKAIILNNHIVVKVSSNSMNSIASGNNRWNQPEFETSLKNSLINYPSLTRPVAGSDAALSLSPSHSQYITTSNPELKIITDKEGMYQVTYQQMVSASFNPSDIDSSTLKMYNQGSEVAILVQDGGNGHIDNPGEYIWFFGVAINDVYTNKNVYWLTYSDGNGKRMTGQDGTPGSAPQAVEFQNLLHAEEDTYYWQTMPEGEGQDHWFWGGRLSPITTGLPYSRTYTVNLDNISTNLGLNANIHFQLKGGTNDRYLSPDHHTFIYINDVLVSDWEWNGFDILDANQVINQASYLHEGNNTVRFECVLLDPSVMVDQIFVNWFEITYWDTYKAENNQLYFHPPADGSYKYHVRGFTTTAINLFNISDPLNPVEVNGTNVVPDNGTSALEFQDTALASDRYLAISDSQLLTPFSLQLDEPSTWKTPDHSADYIVITYDGFYDAVQPLANFRSNQGLHVEVVKVQDLYDEFNYGIFNPQAIRDFLTYAYSYWQPPAPLYVLLVGDAYQDYKDNAHTGSINYVPTQIVETVALGQTPSDNWFVQIAGDDILPDMYIGRLSAQSVPQVAAIVQKIINYEQDQIPSTWGLDGVYVADDDEARFETDSDSFVDLLPPWYTVKKIYVGDYPPGDPRTDIINNINSGTMMVNYLGHGAVEQWGLWGIPPNPQYTIFDNNSVNSLTNTDKLAFFTMESCLNGLFPGNQSSASLAETLQRYSSGGAIAVWAPAGLSFSNGHQLLISELYKAFFKGGVFGLGQATTQAKWNVYAQSTIWGDLLQAYVLFGDPATKLGMAEINHLYIPVVNRNP